MIVINIIPIIILIFPLTVYVKDSNQLKTFGFLTDGQIKNIILIFNFELWDTSFVSSYLKKASSYHWLSDNLW